MNKETVKINSQSSIEIWHQDPGAFEAKPGWYYLMLIMGQDNRDGFAGPHGPYSSREIALQLGQMHCTLRMQ
jgi:hypothetical protein